jgi:hypothetical protein
MPENFFNKKTILFPIISNDFSKELQKNVANSNLFTVEERSKNFYLVRCSHVETGKYFSKMKGKCGSVNSKWFN